MSAYENSVAAAKKGRLTKLAKDRQLRVTRMQMLVGALKSYGRLTRQEAANVIACSPCAASRYMLIMERFGVATVTRKDVSGRVLGYAATHDEDAEAIMFVQLRCAIDNALNGEEDDLEIPTPEQEAEFDRKWGKPQIIRATARQVGMVRDALVTALFGDGPAHSDEVAA